MLRNSYGFFGGFCRLSLFFLKQRKLLTFEHLIDTGAESGLCFRPITPALETNMYIIWKKYQVFSPIAELFLKRIKQDYS